MRGGDGLDHESSGDVGDRWVGRSVCRGFGRRKHGDSFYRHTVFISLYLCLEETAPDPLLCPIYGMQDTKDASSIILPPDPHHQTQHLVSECSPPTLIPASPNTDLHDLHIYSGNLFMIASTVHLSVSGLGTQE